MLTYTLPKPRLHNQKTFDFIDLGLNSNPNNFLAVERVLKKSDHVLDETRLVVKELLSAGAAVQVHIQGSYLSSFRLQANCLTYLYKVSCFSKIGSNHKCFIVLGPIEPDKFFIHGLTEKISRDQLELNLEELMELEVKDVVYGLDPSVAMVVYNGAAGE